jgi:hypothetical protein
MREVSFDHPDRIVIQDAVVADGAHAGPARQVPAAVAPLRLQPVRPSRARWTRVQPGHGFDNSAPPAGARSARRRGQHDDRLARRGQQVRLRVRRGHAYYIHASAQRASSYQRRCRPGQEGAQMPSTGPARDAPFAARDEPGGRPADRHYEAVLGAEIRRLVRELRVTGPLTRKILAERCRTANWHDGSFQAAVQAGIRRGVLRQLPFDYVALNREPARARGDRAEGPAGAGTGR